MMASQTPTEFLSQCGWDGARRQPIAGDLSSRRYTRLLAADGSSAVLMECTADSSLTAFVAMTKWLHTEGLSVPHILHANMKAGFLLLEDFGTDQLSARIRATPSDQQIYFDAAVKALVLLRRTKPPNLETPTAQELVDATQLADAWYAGAVSSALDRIRDVLEGELAALCLVTPTLSLRDFHADNVIWLPGRAGIQQLGLLDYQDAFLTHPAYDLMSLVTDARIDVPDSVHYATLASYAKSTGDSSEELAHAVAVLGVQRNLRIMGIFSRAAQRDGKTFHLDAMPRVRSNLLRCLSHPVFSNVAHLLDDALPPAEAQPV